MVDDLPQRQVVVPPPLHVRGVAEGTDHDDAGALFRVDTCIGDDRHPHVEQWRLGGGADQSPVVGVLRVHEDGDAGGDELRTRRRDHQMATRSRPNLTR